LARQGVRAVQLYCVNLTGIEAVRPAEEIDAAYAQALRAAVADGVEVLAYGTRLDAEQIVVDRRCRCCSPLKPDALAVFQAVQGLQPLARARAGHAFAALDQEQRAMMGALDQAGAVVEKAVWRPVQGMPRWGQRLR
jgi:hypothetical protein